MKTKKKAAKKKHITRSYILERDLDRDYVHYDPTLSLCSNAVEEYYPQLKSYYGRIELVISTKPRRGALVLERGYFNYKLPQYGAHESPCLMGFEEALTRNKMLVRGLKLYVDVYLLD